jgi:hypothetical protein
MPRKGFTAEQIVGKLGEADVPGSQNRSATEACCPLNVSKQRDCGWRKEHGGTRTDQTHQLKEPERRTCSFTSKLTTSAPLPYLSKRSRMAL